ncbi:hypothetical protein BCR42DRAFT_174635 [Absidia repens]|uniref:DNA/RNA-binding protein Alba-like domain-containing protein n=1 Tax=Absidia repens TaxID=90262 RepID=A0A1X2HZG3_9FUNG|nr:hypothetical protein BCR42DRAFT_174635 [Absidia repens]
MAWHGWKWMVDIWNIAGKSFLEGDTARQTMEEYRKNGSSSTPNATESQSQMPPADNEILVAKGKTINKAITTVEIIKRRLNGTLHQYNQIGKVTLTEQWTPINDNELDKIAVDTMLPVIIIHLSSSPLPELDSTATYQAPQQYD